MADAIDLIGGFTQLRCQNVALRSLFAPSVYQDLFRCQRRKITRAAHHRGGRRPVTSAQAAAAALCWRAAAHHEFHEAGVGAHRLEANLIRGRSAAVTRATGRGAQEIVRVAVQGLGGVGYIAELARDGLSFLKIGRAVLYPFAELEAWDRKNLVICHAARVPSGKELEATG